MVSPVGSEEVAAKQGTYRGSHARNTTPNSKIGQSPKAAGVSEALHTNLKTLHQRSVRQGQATNMVATARIADFYDKLPNMPELNEIQGLVETFQHFEVLQEVAFKVHEGQHRREEA